MFSKGQTLRKLLASILVAERLDWLQKPLYSFEIFLLWIGFIKYFENLDVIVTLNKITIFILFSSKPSSLILMFLLYMSCYCSFFPPPSLQSIVVNQVFSLLNWRLTRKSLLKLMFFICILNMYIDNDYEPSYES